MKPLKLNAAILFLVFLGVLFLIGLYPQGEHEIRKTFKNKKVVQLNTFNGDCIVKKGSGNEVNIHFIHSYSKASFEPEFREEGDKLILKEKFHLSGSGDSTWNITVPDKTAIQFQTISGNFTAEGVKGDITANSVSGDISARVCSGDINLGSVSGDLDARHLSGNINIKTTSSDLEINNLSGDIRIRAVSGDIKAERLDGSISVKCPAGDIEINEAKGSFDVKTASGDINANGIIVSGASYFKVASGDVYVTLAKTAEHDITLECASGDAVLNYNGNPIEGYFEFKAADRGKIISPFPFEKEEEEEKWGKKYTIKSFKRELDVPRIYISTIAGRAALKEK
ncbi:MAG: DUF4097 family beta strand repeat protein [Candidatus Aminicenantes bacterium]|nr:MAG: DUF4097 family beta strand repeat protein [Candidatus Aminicenantes bacterium]